ncbi:hypothetical protein DNTS_015277 [Danionella cerebrum]|uniref:protein-tyrosine-phosphatase n=1 Tax=Danionella cerebrum TaxID=2873325 RepID=A0A553MSK1_9TELE|nr:hypothetical protein DNTS_015277 [Danionella translucida]
MKKRVSSFFNRVWKAMKRPFCCKDRVKPFVPPEDTETSCPIVSSVYRKHGSTGKQTEGQLIGSGGCGIVVTEFDNPLSRWMVKIDGSNESGILSDPGCDLLSLTSASELGSPSPRDSDAEADLPKNRTSPPGYRPVPGLDRVTATVSKTESVHPAEKGGLDKRELLELVTCWRQVIDYEFTKLNRDPNLPKTVAHNSLKPSQKRVHWGPYINNNLLDGYKCRDAYIAAEGPLPEMYGDFWRMVWEQKVTVIVMTTRVSTLGKDKCGQYWPLESEQTETFGNIIVRNVYTQTFEDYNLTWLEVIDARTGECRYLSHFQYLTWPSLGAPHSTPGFLTFRKHVKERQESFRELFPDWTGPSCGPPMVVHGDEGIGRTGTFCALDICLSRLEDIGTVDIGRTVWRMRMQRPLCVQTFPSDRTDSSTMKKRVSSFFNRVWKAMKRPFCCKDRVKPFVPPEDTETSCPIVSSVYRKHGSTGKQTEGQLIGSGGCGIVVTEFDNPLSRWMVKIDGSNESGILSDPGCDLLSLTSASELGSPSPRDSDAEADLPKNRTSPPGYRPVPGLDRVTATVSKTESVHPAEKGGLDKRELLELVTCWRQVIDYEFTKLNRDPNLPKTVAHNSLKPSQKRVHWGPYINNNLLDGYKCRDAYIAAEGPLPEMYGDFWRMVWEQKVTVIVMTTRVSTLGKDKCGQYWPLESEQTETFGNIIVRNVYTQTFEDYNLTWLEVIDARTGECRYLSHFQYLTWPSLGAPHSTPGFLTFRKHVKERQESFRELFPDWTGPSCGPPMVVHGDEGIGRTGTFCALDICLSRLEDIGTVDIGRTVWRMRMQRPLCVQTFPSDRTDSSTMKKRVSSFFNRVWKAMKRPFCCKDRVKPFVPPEDTETSCPIVSSVYRKHGSTGKQTEGQLIGSGGCGIVVTEFDNPLSRWMVKIDGSNESGILSDPGCDLLSLTSASELGSPSPRDSDAEADLPKNRTSPPGYRPVPGLDRVTATVSKTESVHPAEKGGLDKRELLELVTCWRQVIDYEFTKLNRDPNLPKTVAHNSLKPSQKRVHWGPYINNNLLDGYKCRDAYIAAEGPLPEMYGDFWRMVWEQKVTVIVMTTRVSTLGKDKCGQYWPLESEQTETFGNIIVRNVYTQTFEDYNLTWLEVIDARTGECRYLSHFQYLTWPSLGAPHSTPGFLTFRKHVKERQESFRELFPDWTGPSCGPPMVVHGDEGIGRTGTFCALDICLSRLEDIGTVDIGRTVWRMRMQRPL